MSCKRAIQLFLVYRLYKPTTLGLFCLFYSTSIFPQTADKPYFKVTPTTCVLEVKESVCKFNILIQFTITPFQELCLEIENRPNHTQCYTEKGLVSKQLRIETSHSLTIKLIDPLNSSTVAEQTLTLAKFDSGDYRVKRRFGWSF